MTKELKPKIQKIYLKRLKEFEEILQNMIEKHVKCDKLILVENKISWKLMLDVVISHDIHLNDIDFLSYSIRKSLKNCYLPEIKINFNNISSEYNIEILENEGKFIFSEVKLPHIFSFGKLGEFFYFGMDFGEFQAVDACFLGVCDYSGRVLEFEKIGMIFNFIFYLTPFLDGNGVDVVELQDAVNKARKVAPSIYSLLN